VRQERRVTKVQYDSGGEWIDVSFDDGRRARFTAGLVYELGRVACWNPTTRNADKEATDHGRTD
jgi:hypothetical protein